LAPPGTQGKPGYETKSPPTAGAYKTIKIKHIPKNESRSKFPVRFVNIKHYGRNDSNIMEADNMYFPSY
jgi:hypothetical protein